MAVIQYKGFEIRTESDCDKNKDGKISKRWPVQILDKNGYHYAYVLSIDTAEARVNNWHTWEERLA